MKIRIQLRPDPRCTRHGVSYPRGGSCDRCARNVVPGTKPTKPRKPAAKNKSHDPYPCPNGCGNQVRGGFCPGADC